MSTIVWFRKDLRIEDNPALNEAIKKKSTIVPLFIWSPEEEGDWKPGGASLVWLHFSLKSLKEELKEIGLDLVIRAGNSQGELEKVIKEANADEVYWNRRYEPAIIKRDTQIKSSLQVDAKSFNSHLLFEPWTVANKQKKPFQVFTPFWKHCLSLGPLPEPLGKPPQAIGIKTKIRSLSVDELNLLPKIQWDKGIKDTWKPGAPNGKEHLMEFVKAPILNYKEGRNFPGENGVSKMSPYLHFGEVSPRMIWHAVLKKHSHDLEGVECYLRELGWREFGYHLLYHFPQTPQKPLQEKFAEFPWIQNSKGLKAWQKGLTGYPIVDAGMRQLWHIGWMHNRVRMIVGSFLVKDLQINWLEGSKWFWDTLVDADLASNTLGWQWVGGCGADAAPYFRVFNPITQGEKFDPKGDYVREWIPEIANLPNEYLHKPWEAPESVLRQAGVTLGKTYPGPIVDHAEARIKALAAFGQLK